ncbi:hypothetical protein BT96DRAFT_919692 [Gymnopus androsaceus JB14]|uniref:Uncharacterized protein n=1 Tax=Gymnopus androsaceus JB14 TaxID=1447944 RepID=A0A6A4HS40_9AGAR|nr:hypothetical protein BT96DRAFT_919692 [Gymnopus androsaceus JB14]
MGLWKPLPISLAIASAGVAAFFRILASTRVRLAQRVILFQSYTQTQSSTPLVFPTHPGNDTEVSSVPFWEVMQCRLSHICSR